MIVEILIVVLVMAVSLALSDIQQPKSICPPSKPPGYRNRRERKM